MDLYKNRDIAERQVWGMLLEKQRDKYHPILSAQQIGDELNLSAGQVIDIIEGLRSRGYTICGFDEQGGFYIGTFAEMLKTIERLKSKVMIAQETIKIWEYRANNKNIENQIEMHF